MVYLRFDAVFYFLKYCKATNPQALFHQEIKVRRIKKKKRALIIVHNIIS